MFFKKYTYKLNLDVGIVKAGIKDLGATLNNNKFEFIGIYAKLWGTINIENDKTILNFKTSINPIFKLFIVLWVMGTGFAFVYTIILNIQNKDFNLLPLISLILLLIGFFLCFFRCSKQLEMFISILNNKFKNNIID
jgi:hypothetical protein